MLDWDFVYEDGVPLPRKCGRVLMPDGRILGTHVCLPESATCQCGYHRYFDRRCGDGNHIQK